jgi:adenine-specific DNA-methyltransferase
MEPYYADDAVQVYEADALDLMATLPDDSVQLIATDPPYFRVKDEAWDNAWPNERAFLRWIGALCKEWRRVLAPNGSLYVFASPQMAHGVERVVRRHFRVLNAITWVKDEGWHRKAEKEAQRSFAAPWERVVFTEQYGRGDVEAAARVRALAPMAEYFARFARSHLPAVADTLRATGRYSSEESVHAHVSIKTGHNPARWDFPDPEVFALLNEACAFDRSFDDLRAEYDERMEAFRVERDAARRPFNATPDAPYTDVWDFPTVSQYPGKHPTEKPLAMFEHIVRLSSRPGDTVLDTFSGSGTTAEAARNLGRKAIVGDSDPHWVRKTAERVSQGSLLADMEAA